jgi:sugar phosphate isomerase/epimerase
MGGAMAAAGLGGAAGAAATQAAAAAPGDIKLGVASYSLREFQRDLAIRMIRQLGVPYVSVKECHLSYRSTPQELEAGAREFEKAGLIIAGGGTIYMMKDDDDDIRRYFDYARACHMPLMTIGPTHENLRRIEKFVKEYDIKVAIHNHGPEQKDFPSPQSVLEVVRHMDPRVGLCIDIGHTARCGVDVVESIALAGPRLFDMHVKDLADFTKINSQCDVGEGIMPFPAIFKQLKKMKYQGCVDLEYEINAKDPLPGVLRSMFYMRGVLAGLAAA